MESLSDLPPIQPFVSLNSHLEWIANQLKQGEHVAPVRVREFLSWFGAQRRGVWIIWRINEALESAGIHTVPDYRHVYIEATVQFALNEVDKEVAVGTSDGGVGKDTVSIEVSDEIEETSVALVGGPDADPIVRIGQLASANTKLVAVKPDTSLEEVTTLMLLHDYSQLPVMTNPRDLKGMVSWQSIGKCATLGRSPATARECMEGAHVVEMETSLFSALDLVIKHGHVFTRGDDRSITGIVTTSDLSSQFQILAEPFLLLSEIENQIRGLIKDRFTVDELRGVKDSSDNDRVIEDVADLTLGEYVRLLQNPCNWDKLGIPLSRSIVMNRLDDVRRIRNEVMHFDPDGVAESDLVSMREFAGLLRELRPTAGNS